MNSIASITLLGKRKRNQVSYAEPSINDIDDGDEEVMEDEDEVTDDDGTYGLRKKLRSSAKKRARLTAPKPKRERPQKPFPFLSLPAELRDYIYELALTDNGGVTLVSSTKAFRRIVRRGEVSNEERHYISGVWNGGQDSVPIYENALSPNLLAVNKQVHTEAVAWLYQQPLVVQDTMTLHTFLAAIGPSNRKIVTDIIVKGWGGGRGTHKAMNVAALTSLADCTNLKTFRLDCDIAWFRRPRDLARQLYRDGHFFFESLGAVKGKKDAIVDVLELSDGNFNRGSYYGWRGNTTALTVEEGKEGFCVQLRKLLGC